MLRKNFPSISAKQKKWFIVIAAILLLVCAIGIIYGLSIRKEMLDKAIAKARIVLKQDYALNFEVKEYGFAGLSTVEFSQVRISPDSGQQLASIENVQISVKILPLLSKKIRLDRVDLQGAFVTLVKEDSIANYDFIFRKKAQQDTTAATGETRNLAQLADRLINQAFDKIPANMKLEQVELSYQDSSGIQRIRVPEGYIRGGKYNVDVFLNENDAKWNLTGRINRRGQEFSVTISSENPNVELPVLRNKYGLIVNFESITFDLNKIERHGIEQFKILGECEFKNFKVNHRRLSDKDVLIPHVIAQGGLLISENSLEIVEGTSVRVKDFEFKPQIKYINKPSKQISLAIHTGKFNAQHLFDAIPTGLFETLEGIEVEGEIAYDLDFSVNLEKPDDLTFVSKIDDKALKIKKWGNANIPALNTAFAHESYEDTVKMRNIILGSENTSFTPLNKIAPILKTTVLNTEDPFFYEHQGFEEEAFELSIVTNIKERAFKRGASTISMQLVKNLYLHRNKTMMRKLEEILLVWLMEQSGEVSKDRLLEVYFNIIEWGKNVYGITEASKYYFGKAPQDINIGESLYLSSIIPRPKTGLSSFDYTGHLKPWVKRHFNTYGYIMNKRNQLNDVSVPEDYGFYGVVLQPHLRPPRPKGIIDSIPTSDELHDMIEEIDNQERQRRTLWEKMFGKDESKNQGE